MEAGDIEIIDVRDDSGYPVRPLLGVTEIVIHHDGVRFGDDDVVSETVRVNATRNHHRSIGWPGIGYHYYIFPSGRVYYVGSIDTIRYHCGGLDDPSTPPVVSAHNEHSIGVCFAGNFNDGVPTSEALASCVSLILGFGAGFGLFVIVGHKEEADGLANATDYPGHTWYAWKPIITNSLIIEAEQNETEDLLVKKDTIIHALNVIWGVGDLLSQLDSSYSHQLKDAVNMIKWEWRKVGVNLP